MKKFIFGLSAITIIITGIFTFAGCEKEEENNMQEDQCATCQPALYHNWNVYYRQQIQYFAENYGIDVHEFSSNEHLLNLILDFNELASDILGFMMDASLDQLEESIHFLEQKQNELQEFENSGDNFGILSVAEEIFATIMPSKPMNEYFHEGNFYLFPIDYMEAKNEFLSCELHQLKESHLFLQNMCEDDFKKLLETSAYILATDENHADIFYFMQTDQGNAYNECLKNAENRFKFEYEGVIINCISYGIACGTLPPPINFACGAAALVRIYEEIYYAKIDYEQRLQDCWNNFHGRG